MAMMSIPRALLAKIKSTPLPSCRTYHGWETFASLNPCLWCRHPTPSRGLFLLLRGSPCCWFCTLRLQSDLFIQGHLVSWRGSWAIVPLCMGHMQPWKQSCSFHRAPLCLFSLLSHCNVRNIVTISFSLHGCQSHLSLRPYVLQHLKPSDDLPSLSRVYPCLVLYSLLSQITEIASITELA